MKFLAVVVSLFSLIISLPVIAAPVTKQVPQALVAQSDFLKEVSRGESELDLLDFMVTIQHGGTHYKYKFGLAKETNCADANGYSVPMSTAEELVKDISSFPDGEVVLCLIGLKINKGSSAGEQPFSEATRYNWLRAKRVKIPTATITEPTFLSDMADGTSTMTSLNVPVNVRFGNAYQFKLGIASNTVCTDASGYSSPARKGIALSADLNSLPDTQINLCLLGIKLRKGVVIAAQPVSEATVYSWVKGPLIIVPPGPFSILTPSGVVTTQTPLFSWQASNDATSYDLIVASDPDCLLGVQSFSGLTQTSFTSAIPFTDGTYYTCVKARNAATDPTFATNSGLSFGVDVTPPAAFAIIGPTGTIGNNAPVVNWEESVGATSYHLVVSKDSDCSSTIQDYPALTVPFHALAELSDGTYFTCVVAQDDVGYVTSASNNGLSFTVDATPPEAFAILEPSGLIANNRPTVLWQASNGATAYDFVIASTPSCSGIIEEHLNLSVNSKAVGELVDGTYFICVTAKDSTGHSTTASNNALEFSVDTQAPLPFEITGPSGFISTSTPLVTWQAAVGATSYDLLISADSACSSVVLDYADVTTTSQILDELADGTYYICITAKDALNYATNAINDGLSFTIDTLAPEAFDIVSPSGLVANPMPTVVWTEAIGADLYDLVISASSDCNVVVQGYANLTATSQDLQELADGTYYTCVTAKDLLGHAMSATNNGLSFTVDSTAPLSFAILGPSGTITTNTPNVTWEPSVDAAFYDLVISVNSDCSVPVQQYVDLTATSQALTELADGTYYICINAEDTLGHVTAASNNGLMFTVNTAPTLRHTMFVTTALTGVITNPSFPPPEGVFGSLQGADWNCTDAAAAVGLISQWDGQTIVYKAILSAPGINARDRISISAPVYNVHGDLVANNAADMWDGSLQNPVLYDQYGNSMASTFMVWTGTLSSGTTSSNTCGTWNTNYPANGTVGDVRSKTTTWLNNGGRSCSLTAHLYCVSPAHP